jgi:hypothetical protein
MIIIVKSKCIPIPKVEINAESGGLDTSHTRKFSELLDASGKTFGSGLMMLNNNFELKISLLNDPIREIPRLRTIKSPKNRVLFLSLNIIIIFA